MSYLKKKLEERLKDPKFRQEWEDSELEYVIARNIIHLRKKKHLTQIELAEALKTKQSVISRIENANQNLSIDTIKEIAKALDVNVMEIVRESPETYEIESK
ncbi:helix-turn-helix domain-containing protein [Lentibacillus sp. CBA3610]|uniref:helix-turn-helix domain-containing protein n=1 Tax=Lentibacillus sp. CBA3610 TaxID=2518176 RepID=UPI001595F3B6|nr:helix-turn-helix transcriptional regulator [Lentibacillus sp. CBA3610]QKY69851.1 XRE family transcriptional regulator [Lentibacillus sp. CBA3610]